MSKTADLDRKAREFADDISDLLNRTIARGIRLRFNMPSDKSTEGWVGYQTTRQRPRSLVPIPITIGRAPPRCYLLILHRVQMDPEGAHIATASSRVELHLTEDLQTPIARYDYNREPVLNDRGIPYPDAHIHVHGTGSAIDLLAEKAQVRRRGDGFHWPAGGRRFRPTLEDIVEFLIVEGLVQYHPRWHQAVEEHRARWEETQLRAAIRRNREIAIDALNSV